MKTVFYFISVILLFIFAACEDYKDCNSPVATALGIGFYHMIDEEEADSTLPALTFYAVEKPDSVLIYRQAANRIFVPLNPHTTSTRFFIQPDSTLSGGDTLELIYKVDLQFVSSGCGFTNYYQLDTATATNHYIDSIALINNKIITTNATNVKIYY